MTFIEMVHLLPIATTFLSAFFTYDILNRWSKKRDALYLLWWGIGVAIYGLGTLLESLNTLLGWNVIIFKSWYIAGALLGGAPLAIGTIYLLMSKKAGHIAVVILTVSTAITSTFVILSPVDIEMIRPALNSDVLIWQDIRLVSPFINGFAALFLIGGALYSAMNYKNRPELKNRYLGNIFIAIGAILPGVGGGFSRMGYTEVLYIGELLGLILIWYGYKKCQKSPNLSKIHQSDDILMTIEDS